MTVQNYKIDPYVLRDAIGEIMKDQDAVLVISGPNSSGKSTLCSSLKSVLPTLRERIHTIDHLGRPVGKHEVVLNVTTVLDLSKGVPEREILPIAVKEIGYILGGKHTSYSLFNDEPPWLNDQPPWNTGSRAKPSKETMDAVKTLIMLEGRGKPGIGADAMMFVCVKLYRANDFV